MDDPWLVRQVPSAPRHVADVGRTLGETILEWRTRRGWSQRSLETISGVNQSTFSRLERGLSNGMGLINLGRLAWALNAGEAVLRALAPYGEEDIRGGITSGYGPTGNEIDRALSRTRPPTA